MRTWEASGNGEQVPGQPAVRKEGPQKNNPMELSPASKMKGQIVHHLKIFVPKTIG